MLISGLHMHMSICAYILTYIHAPYMCVHTYILIYVHMNTYALILTCIHAHEHLCMNAYSNTYMYPTRVCILI